MYQRALALAPGLVEAEDALIERLTDEGAGASWSPSTRRAAPG
jgi:hypothetical protein